MSQLKNGGGLRIIRKVNVLEKINLYEEIKYLVLRQSDDTWRLTSEIENGKANHLFDFTGPSNFRFTGNWKFFFGIQTV